MGSPSTRECQCAAMQTPWRLLAAIFSGIASSTREWIRQLPLPEADWRKIADVAKEVLSLLEEAVTL